MSFLFKNTNILGRISFLIVLFTTFASTTRAGDGDFESYAGTYRVMQLRADFPRDQGIDPKHYAYSKVEIGTNGLQSNEIGFVKMWHEKDMFGEFGPSEIRVLKDGEMSIANGWETRMAYSSKLQNSYQYSSGEFSKVSGETNHRWMQKTLILTRIDINTIELSYATMFIMPMGNRMPGDPAGDWIAHTHTFAKLEKATRW